MSELLLLLLTAFNEIGVDAPWVQIDNKFMSSIFIRQQIYTEYFYSTTNLYRVLLFDNKFMPSTFIRQLIYAKVIH